MPVSLSNSRSEAHVHHAYDVCAMVELGVEIACGRRPGGVEVALTGTVLDFGRIINKPDLT